MTTAEEYGTALEPVEVVDAELVDDAPGAGKVAVHDPVAAVLAALGTKAAEDLHDRRPRKTKNGYARDWELWQEFHVWLEVQTGTRLPDSAITVGTCVAFVTWLDEVKQAAPSSIERRVTGMAAEARRYGYAVPQAARTAATRALKPLKNDNTRQQRGRGKAAALSPADLRAMAEAPRERKPQPTARRRTVYRVPELARLRDQALSALKVAVAGRNQEMSKLDDPDIRVVDAGLMVRMPSVAGRPEREVPVTYGEHRSTCPVRCWQAYRAAKLAAGAVPGGPAFLPVDQWGHQGTRRLSPDGVGRVLARSAKYAGLTGRRSTGRSAVP
ncbi:hypothetical protein [Streptomyces silvensis]|uniref:Integrase n=1 Tax=Streptomyces silvensis TaxID=1765722 RepID=A0A0W7X3C0_9ACTN|nr:hypothetical protein [Streptomyces silvensis]KUF17358.1 hypothetical protein AT728_16270 [Streptomyces silvensis]